MIIALPSRDGRIDDHFGHCEYFSVIEIKDKEIIKKIEITSPESCGCKSGVAPMLAEKGVTLMLAGNMGQGAVNKLQENGIGVIRGCKGNIDEVIKQWINGELVDNKEICHNHDC